MESKKVFVSHSFDNEDLAKEICEILEKSGISCWIAEEDIVGGTDYATEIFSAIKNCKIVLLLASSHMNVSEHIKNEIEIATKANKKILPFIIDNVVFDDYFDYYLSKSQYIKALPDPEDYYDALVSSVSYLLGTPEDKIDTINDYKLKRIIEKNKKQLYKKTAENRLSLQMSIDDENKYTDNHHFYEKIERYDMVINESKEYKSYRWLTIKNVSDKPTTYIIHLEAGENRIFFKDMKIQAIRIEGENKIKLKVDSITATQPNFRQAFKIFFDKSLEPNESIVIGYTVTWPNEVASYTKNEMSQSIALDRYAKGAKELIFGILSPDKPYGFVLAAVDKQFEYKTMDLPLTFFKAEDIIKLKKIHNMGLCGAYFIVEDVGDNHLYRICYNISDYDEETNEEEDDF